MKTIVDTCVWSVALRHSKSASNGIITELKNLILDFRVQMIGPIRQEILSGIKHETQFQNLKENLSGFTDLQLNENDYILAAQFYNLCRSKGIQGSNTDFLICAVSANNNLG
ncbi:MAG: PIN domain nuclease, partial [Deltaproteobacteria bacterium]|nr:PIN domain nuclease [Deltaproteobacteria bacterium]